MYRKFGKRLLDVVVSSLALLFLSPFMLLICLAIRLEDGGPAIFRQKRLGRGGKVFTLYKFRSLPVKTPDLPSNLGRAIVPTSCGKILRRTNMDELPQLWNILIGEMSLVGPRPILPSQVELHRLREANGITDAIPGLTGLTQVEAYDDMTYAEKAETDTKYCRHLSFPADLAIIGRTFGYLTKPPPSDA